ncbi:MAG: hypothetical protein ACFFDN_52400 [Candidatus Hodarchaeota archaeon]
MKNKLLLICIILFGLALILYYFNIEFLYWLVVDFAYIILSVIIFQKIRNYYLKYPKKVPGRVFEFSFFLLLFMASYSITLYVGGVFRELMIIILIVSLIGATHCGHMHYIDGLHTQNYTKKGKK